MLKPVFQQVHNIKHFFLAYGFVFRAQVQNQRLTPFVEVLDTIEQGDDQLPVDFDATLVS